MRAFLIAFAAVGLLAVPAQADTFGFQDFGVVETGTTDASSQGTMVVTDNGGGTVKFLFTWAGSIASKVQSIHFDQNDALPSALLTSMVIDDPGGAGMTVGAEYNDTSPGNFPQGNTLSPVFEDDFEAKKDGSNSLDHDEADALQIVFSATFADVISALGNGNLRVGLHIGGFAGGGSDSYINTDGSNGSNGGAPEPTSLVLAAVGLAGAFFLRRRR